MKKSLLYLALLFLFIQSHQVFSQGFEKACFVHHGDTLRYRILWPNNFEVEKTYPLVLFLHGAGERGNDNEKQLVHGSALFTDSTNRADFQAVFVFPQCNKDDYWAKVEFTKSENGKRNFHYKPNDNPPTQALSLVISLIDSLLLEKWLDKSRIYVGGLSMGGMGTFELLYRKPETFAAAFPICGGGDPATAVAFAKDVAIWVFHGEVDSVVPVSHSQTMVNAIKEAEGNPRFTVYPGVDHNSWDNVFAEKELLPWLFSQHKK